MYRILTIMNFTIVIRTVRLHSKFSAETLIELINNEKLQLKNENWMSVIIVSKSVLIHLLDKNPDAN